MKKGRFARLLFGSTGRQNPEYPVNIKMVSKNYWHLAPQQAVGERERERQGWKLKQRDTKRDKEQEELIL